MTRAIRCRQHGLKAPVDRELNDPESDILRIAQCLHPSARITKVFWDNVLKGDVAEACSGICRVDFVNMEFTGVADRVQ